LSYENAVWLLEDVCESGRKAIFSRFVLRSVFFDDAQGRAVAALRRLFLARLKRCP
jgi:hypothetical protein